MRFLHSGMIVMFLLLSMISTAAAQGPVKLGIDNIDQYLDVFAGQRVGLITNATGINSDFKSSIDVLNEKTNLVALFSPEHGLRGSATAGDTVGNTLDSKTGIIVYSLYGSTKKPTADMLDNIDVLCFDVQDVGARCYTYIYTMAYAMQACAEQNKTFVVFDRPNPVGGEMVEGGLVKPGFESFVGMYPIPMRHGMTVGELAQLFNTEFNIHCNLIVVKMSGWHRAMMFEDTKLPWIMTSPNIPTPDSALVYSGTGLLGGTNISEGVGTTRPFELVGAPWIDGIELAEKMNSLNLPGVVFRPAWFTPKYAKYQDEACGGVQIHVVDKKSYQAVRVGIMLLSTIKNMQPDNFKYTEPYRTIDIDVGDSALREGRYPVAELLKIWDKEAENFKVKAKKYYLYN